MERLSIDLPTSDGALDAMGDAPAFDSSNRPVKKSSSTCATCRARKVKCDGRRDMCQNCERLGFTCSFQDTGSPAIDAETAASFSLPRRRVRLACINCHSRKARCSGETPKCARCQSQGIECVYKPTKRSGGVNGSSTHYTGTGTGTDSDHDSIGSEPPEKRPMLRKDDNGAHHGRVPGQDDASYDLSRAPAARIFGHEPIQFPDETLILRTFNNFFRHVHHVPVFSFLHRASLMQRYHSGMMDRALLLALVGLTSLLTDLGPGMREYGTKCIDECQNMILQDLENPSTIKIQALLLIMKHRMLSRRFTGAFMLAATAARFAYALRLNYENPGLCFLARESRRRLMWAFVTIDSGINGGYPDFTLLPSESMHIQLPCNERNFEFDLPQVTEHLRPIPTKPFPDDVGSLALHVRLLWMRSRVLYCTKNVLAMPDTEIAQLPELVKVLEEELQGFNEHLPASFKFSDSNLQLRAYSPRLCVFIMIHIWWRQCHSDLYRVVLSGLKEALPRSAIDRLHPQFVMHCARRSYEHALAMAEIFRSIHQLDGGLPVTDLDLPACAYQCARMLFHAHQMHAGEFGISADLIMEHTSRCLQVAKTMAHLPAGAAIVSDLEKLISNGLSASSSPSLPASPAPGAVSVISQQVLSRHNPVQQMRLTDDNDITAGTGRSPSNYIPSPHGNGSVHTPTTVQNMQQQQQQQHQQQQQQLTTQPQTQAQQQQQAMMQQQMAARGMPYPDMSQPLLNSAIAKPNLPPVVPPEGLDNNNAFEGAMDGFDFNFVSYGSTGLESVSWFSNEWLNTEFPQTAV
ncbi:uncharacterized protein B0I36DRAFT_430789 [Microdochium trichocladiopsis]|uniref:Zn(2)-C6 fungal-type domain-containing protein n=1 Tax=Microdochium trichocladiopsis TaxID=1682393 RepID=A0A9P9BPZ0_9PEZI|nr:uncharacterized protein B0I36DRAFT_430789 [Microdochium trichocladiopsis]KAH7033609.1 hypothetical protein B0I36DRAFT_430789 [Microdochium trichocladiopsis]